MGFLDTLRGGGNKDGMRQTTSLTMAYLLEQNARFEVFMRQRVEELETIVTQQEARASSSAQEEALPDDGEETWSEEDGWPEAEEADDFGADVTASTFAFPSVAQDETRPVPVMPVVGQFVLDDVVGFESEAPAGEDTPPSQAEMTTLPSSLDPVAGEPATGGSGGEPAEPPDWQAMLLGHPKEETDEVDRSVDSDDGTGPAEADEFSRLKETASKVKAAGEEQAVLPAEVVGDDEAWDTALDQTGPVEEWA